MVDHVSKEKRSEIMAAVHNHGNRTTEKHLRDLLLSSEVSGWRENAKDIFGKPDFVFDNEKVAVFVDGCFWHGCTKHKYLPRTNTEYWANKIVVNVARDQRVHRKLRRQGWHVIRIWEHDLKKRPEFVIKRIVRTLESLRAPST
jgi:DNA mismatch endonuclease (patch repair protein)